MSDTTDTLPGERHVSAVAGQRWLSRRHGAMLIGLGGVCVAAWFAFHGSQATKRDAAPPRATTIRQVSAFEPPPETLAGPPPPPQAQPQPQRTLLQQVVGQVAEDPLAKAREAPLLRDSEAQQHQVTPDTAVAAAPQATAAASAGVRAHRQAAQHHPRRHHGDGAAPSRVHRHHGHADSLRAADRDG